MSDVEIIKKAVETFTDVIASSDCYKTYAEMKKIVESDAELCILIAKYKELNYNFSMKKINNSTEKKPSLDEQKYISKIYWQLMLDKNSKAFLEAEKQLGLLIRGIFSQTAKKMEINLNFYI